MVAAAAARTCLQLLVVRVVLRRCNGSLSSSFSPLHRTNDGREVCISLASACISHSGNCHGVYGLVLWACNASGSPSVLRMGDRMPDGWRAVLLAITEIWALQSVLGFIAPMWLVGIGVATAVSVAPNGALRGFDHVAGTVT